MTAGNTPPTVVWICRECWKRRQGNEVFPTPTFISTCAECGAKDVPLAYVKVEPASKTVEAGQKASRILQQDRGRVTRDAEGHESSDSATNQGCQTGIRAGEQSE